MLNKISHLAPQFVMWVPIPAINLSHLCLQVQLSTFSKEGTPVTVRSTLAQTLWYYKVLNPFSRKIADCLSKVK